MISMIGCDGDSLVLVRQDQRLCDGDEERGRDVTEEGQEFSCDSAAVDRHGP